MRRISPSCRSYCANRVFIEGGGLSRYLVAARMGTDWANRTRLCRAGQPSIVPVSGSGTVAVYQVYRCTTDSFAPPVRVVRCRRRRRKLQELSTASRTAPNWSFDENPSADDLFPATATKRGGLRRISLSCQAFSRGRLASAIPDSECARQANILFHYPIWVARVYDCGVGPREDRSGSGTPRKCRPKRIYGGKGKAVGFDAAAALLFVALAQR